jgi:GT2 family glycosyltransferase
VSGWPAGTAGRAPSAGDVSVVIRTFDTARWNDLQQAVASVRRQTVPPREVIVVVDHNPDLLALATAWLPGVRVVQNGEARGASGGMNSGVAAAGGDVVAFLDDDAVAAPDWLEQLLYPYRDSRVLGVGGWIEPGWTGRRPEWFPPEFSWVVGCTFPGGFDGPGPVRSLIGANMSFRREIFERMPGFRTGVGAVGRTLTKCEDTEFCIRVSRRWPQGLLLYRPQAMVVHRVSPERATWRYFRARCFAEGMAKAQVSHLVGAERALASERSYATRVLPRGLCRNLGDALRRSDTRGGLLRAGAIVAGLGLTTAGFVAGEARARQPRAWPWQRFVPWRAPCAS